MELTTTWPSSKPVFQLLRIRSSNIWLASISFFSSTIAARTAFEKMTDVDYQGETYYTIRNLSLYECQGWCREEVECQAASFSFVANGLGQQETVCLLQNGTQANNPTSKPIRARNQYYMVKMSIRSGELQMNIISCILTFMKSLIYQPV